MSVTKHGTARTPKSKRWVATVKTDSTHPPEGLFTKDAATIARSLASKRVSPKGPALACECSPTSSTGLEVV